MSDDNELDTSSVDTTPLSLAEAAKAFAGTPDTEEPEQGQPDVEDAPEGDDQAEDAELESDEGESEDTEGDPEEEGQAEDEEQDEESDQGRFVSPNGKVKLPDGKIVSIADLIAGNTDLPGNLRDRDYRQKTMAHAEDVKTFKAQSEVVKQRETKVAEQAKYVADLLQSIMPPAPDPEMADPNSPKFDLVKYIAAEATHKNWSAHLNYLSAEQQKQAEAADAEAKTGKKQKADAEWEKLLGKVPEFKDEKRVEAFVKQSFSTGEAYGFTKAEISDALASDHRMVLVLKDAMRARRMDAAKAKITPKLENKPPVLKGGQRLDPARAKAKDGRAAMERLNESGSLKDGIAALLATQR